MHIQSVVCGEIMLIQIISLLPMSSCHHAAPFRRHNCSLSPFHRHYCSFFFIQDTATSHAVALASLKSFFRRLSSCCYLSSISSESFFRTSTLRFVSFCHCSVEEVKCPATSEAFYEKSY